MAQQVINTGTFPNDATGDPAQTAFIKINNNFGQLFGTSAGVTFGPPPFPPGGIAVTINAATNSPALVVNGVSSSNAITINNLANTSAIAIINGAATGNALQVTSNAGVAVNALTFGQAGQSLWTISEPAASSNFNIGTGAITPLVISNTGFVTMAAPNSGVTSSAIFANTGSGAGTKARFQLNDNTADLGYLEGDANGTTVSLKSVNRNNQLDFWTGSAGGAQRVLIASNGAVSINAPAATVPALTVQAVTAATYCATFTGGSGFACAIGIIDGGAGNRAWQLRNGQVSVGVFDLFDNTANASRFSITPSGNITIAAPSSGNALTTNCVASGRSIVSLLASSGSGAISFSANDGGSTGNFLLEAATANFSTTGAAAAVLTANKPGAGTAVTQWIRVLLNGTTGWIPFWAN